MNDNNNNMDYGDTTTTTPTTTMKQSSTSTSSVTTQQVIRDVYHHDNNNVPNNNNNNNHSILLNPRKEGTEFPPDYQPTELDVCSGRGKQHWHHPGNVAFRQLIQGMVHSYMSEPTKADKTAFVSNVVEEMRKAGCQFLKQNENGNWYEIGDVGGRDKVAHALRDQVTAIKKENKQQLQNSSSKKSSNSTTTDSITLSNNSSSNNNNSSNIINITPPPPPPPLERRNSLALSDSGNEADLRRESLHSTVLHHQFARRPSWIAGESSGTLSGSSDGPGLNQQQHHTIMMPVEQLPAAVSYERQRRESSWEFLNQYEDVFMSLANEQHQHEQQQQQYQYQQQYYPIQGDVDHHQPQQQHQGMEVDNSGGMYHNNNNASGQQQQQQQHGSIQTWDPQQHGPSGGSATNAIEETTLQARRSDILKDHLLASPTKKEHHHNDHNHNHADMMRSSIKGWDPRRSSVLSTFSNVRRSIFFKEADESFSNSMNYGGNNNNNNPNHRNSFMMNQHRNSIRQSIASTRRNSRMSGSTSLRRMTNTMRMSDVSMLSAADFLDDIDWTEGHDNSHNSNSNNHDHVMEV